MSVKECIENRLKELAEKSKAKDYQGCSKIYAENCVVMPATGELLTGRNELAKFWEAAYGKANFEFTTNLLDVCGDENGIVVSRGSWTATEGNDKTCGYYLLVWKKCNNEFQIHQDIWNSNKKQ